MERPVFDRLFIFEMANNHAGSLEHGVRIIRGIKEICAGFDFQFAFKFQYRDLDTFIHPDFRACHDLKYIKRFSQTRLTEADFLTLLGEVKNSGFLSMCTPFDEPSVQKVAAHGFDMVKTASCSLTDWPLIEAVAQTKLPVIASTAGEGLEQIDKVVSFFEHRNKELCLMHCVGVYPTEAAGLELNQIDLLKKRYPGVPVGFSTHERPDNLGAVQVAIAKGACAFERHVNVATDLHGINAYSSTPEQIKAWLTSAKEAFDMCGVQGRRYEPSAAEKSDLRGLKRGVYARQPIAQGGKISVESVFFAIPNTEDQLLANDMSKYTEYEAQADIKAGAPILQEAVIGNDSRPKVLEIIQQVRDILVKSGIKLPNRMEMELSHHYGIDRFSQRGAAILNLVNREYCKKLVIVLPGQSHPVHHHVKKEETFHVLYGDVTLNLDGKDLVLDAGEILTIERGSKHSFFSKTGCIFEEVSTTSVQGDSYYEDRAVAQNSKRKTHLTFWSDWLVKSPQ